MVSSNEDQKTAPANLPHFQRGGIAFKGKSDG